MRIRTLLAAYTIIAGTASPSFAFEAPTSAPSSNQLIQTVSCNPNEDDKQARCMRVCDDAWIKATQAYSGKIDEAKVTKKACETKCGCQT